jgi:hypothetical protein
MPSASLPPTPLEMRSWHLTLGTVVAGEGLEQPRRRSCGGVSQALIPVAEGVAHPFARRCEVFDLMVHRIEHPLRRCPDLVAGPAPAIADAQEVGDLAERESEALCVADERNSIQHGFWILPISSWRPSGSRQDADTLVVANRIGAHARTRGEPADSQQRRHVRL